MQTQSESVTYHNLTPIQSDEFLPPVSAWMTLGGLFLVGTCGVAIALAAFTPYKVTVKAPATIRPVGELRLVQSPIQGAIKSIVITENQSVQEGEIIAKVDDSRLKTKKSQLQNNLTQNKQQVQQIESQIIALDRQMTAEKDRSQRAIASAQAELKETQRDYQDKQITTTSQVQEAEANLKQAQEELQKAQALLTSAQAEQKATEAALKAAIAKRDRYQPIAEQGALSQDQYQEARIAVIQQEQALVAKKATVEAQQQDIQRLSSAVKAAEARLNGALAPLNPSNAKVVMTQEKIAQERANRNVSVSRLSQEREQLIQQRWEMQKQINQDRDELQQIKTEVGDTVIRAPVSGIIQQLNLRNLGQMVNIGEEIAQIASSEESLIIKALVSPQDIAKVEVGQQVQMRVSACPYPDYGTLLGTVKTISPDVIITQPENAKATTNKHSNSNKQKSNYNVTIQQKNLELSFQSRSCAIQSGMEGRADIITQQETVLTFILRKARLLTNF